MASTPPTQLFTNALLAMLKAEYTSGVVYDTMVPQDAAFPYMMLSVIPGGEAYGPQLTAPDADLEIVYQIDGVALRRDAAQYVADRATEIVLGRNSSGAFVSVLTPPAGWAVCGRMRNDVPGGVVPEGAPPRTVYTASNRYTLAVTPT